MFYVKYPHSLEQVTKIPTYISLQRMTEMQTFCPRIEFDATESIMQASESLALV